MKKWLALVLSAALAVQLASPALALDFFTTVDEDTYAGKEIAMEQQEGEVGIANSAGRELTLRDGSSLYNGYEVYTEEGYVWVSLDNNGVLKMDMDTEIKIEKNGNNLEVVLIDGEVFFNISESFTDEETFTITTSTMTTGIRGTSGVVSTKTRADSGTEFQIKLFEGDVELTYLVNNATNQNYAVELSAGRTFWLTTGGEEEPVLDENGNIVYESHLSDLGEGDINGFAAVEIKNSEELQKKILDADGVIDQDLMETIVGTADEKLEEDQGVRKAFVEQVNAEKEASYQSLLPQAQPTTEEPTTEEPVTEEPVTTEDTTVVVAAEDTSTTTSTTSDETAVVDITVTYYNGTVVFATQSATSAAAPTEPYLQPTSSGSWYYNGAVYDFTTALTADASLYWVSVS